MDWAAVAAVFAGVGLLVQARAIKFSAKATELSFLVGLHKDLAELERNCPGQSDRARFKQWLGRFLNQLELLSFVINHGYVDDRRLVRFVGDAFLHWHEEIFLKLASEEEKSNSGIFNELKDFYARLTSDPNVRRRVFRPSGS